MNSQRNNLSTFFSLIPLVISFSLALLTVANSRDEPNIITLQLFLVIGTTVIGAYGFWTSKVTHYSISLGGLLIWSCCSLALQGESILLVWLMLFAQLGLLLTGQRGMWLSGHSIQQTRAWYPLVRELLTIYEWLGAAAIISVVVLLVAPFFNFGLSLPTIGILCAVAIISFAFLAMSSIGSNESQNPKEEEIGLK